MIVFGVFFNNFDVFILKIKKIKKLILIYFLIKKYFFKKIIHHNTKHVHNAHSSYTFVSSSCATFKLLISFAYNYICSKKKYRRKEIKSVHLILVL
jgi:hypothetical protein